jgi:hypothetical protein
MCDVNEGRNAMLKNSPLAVNGLKRSEHRTR